MVKRDMSGKMDTMCYGQFMAPSRGWGEELDTGIQRE